ncbi:MAG TPA: DUF2283 domain-containing protein [Solirubrobacterales bacterium]|jgi:uncharacterized protein YuzE
MYAHYDREVDIAWFRFGVPGDGSVDRSEETDWGLIDRTNEGQVVGLEFWRASERLPRELLDALPEPAEEEVPAR